MKFTIEHESRGRLRVKAAVVRMSENTADILEGWLLACPAVAAVTVHEATACAIIRYEEGKRSEVTERLACFDPADSHTQALAVPPETRQLRNEYRDKAIRMAARCPCR